MRKVLMIPRKLVEQKPYSNMSEEARQLYAALLFLKETMSGEKNWIDGRGFRYLVIPKKELQSFLECSRYMADKYTRELELMGLIRFEYVRAPLFERRIYVRSFEPSPNDVNIGYTEYGENSIPDKPCDHTVEGHGHSSEKEPGVEEAGKRKEETVDKPGEKADAEKDCISPEESRLVDLFFARARLKSISMLISSLEEALEDIYESME